MGLLDGIKSHGFLAHSLGMVACFLCFVGSVMSLVDCWAWLYMLFLGFFLAAVEAPFCLKCCENENTVGVCKKALVAVEYVSGISRVFIYILSILPLFTCPELTTVLIALCLLGSAFNYLMDWLGPRGGGAQRVATEDVDVEDGRQDLLTDADREDTFGIDDEDEYANDQVEHTQEGATKNPWDRFVDNAAEQAGQAVAAAVTAQVKNEINAANPFAQLNKSADTAAPGSPTRRSSGKEGNPFAKNDGEEADKEGNPFA